MANGDDATVQAQPAATDPANVTQDVMGGLVSAEGLASRGLTQPVQTIPVSTQLPAGQAPLIPTVQPAYTVEHNLDDQHMSGLRGVLHKVASIMAPSDTYHVSKDADGMVNITRTPATTGEMWGRIAAAALGGAAAGMGQQGVNAPAKSVGAGFQVGQQVAEAGKTQAEQEAQAQQNLMLRNAQMARIHQQIAEAQFNDKLAPIREARQEAQEALNFKNSVEDDGGTDYGTYSTPQEMIDLANAHPELTQYHMGVGGQLIKVPQLDGTTHVYGIPENAGATRLTESRKLPDIVNVDADGKVTTEPGQTMPKGTRTKTYYEALQTIIGKNIQSENIASQIKQRAATPGGKPGPSYAVKDEKTGLTYQVTPRGPGQPPDIQPITLPGGGTVSGRLGTAKPEDTQWGQAAEGLGPTPTTPAEEAGTAVGELQDQPTFLTQFTNPPSPQGQAILDRLPTGQANLVRRFGNYLADERAELPRGKERGPFLDLVSSVYPNFSSAAYPARLSLIKSLQGDGKMAQSRNALNLAIQHMGEMYTNLLKVNPSELTAENKAQRAWHDQGFGDKTITDAYGGYDEANEGVASETARVFKGGSPTQGEIAEYRTHTDITMPRSKQIGALRTRAHMLADRLENLNQQLRDGLGTPNRNFQLLTPGSIETLRNLPGGDEILRRAGVPIPAPRPAGPAPAPAAEPPAPAGATMEYRDPQGNLKGWAVNGKYVPRQ